MIIIKIFFTIFLYYLPISQLNHIKISAAINNNSLIKIFCIRSVKAEMKKTNFKYNKIFVNQVCDCYLGNLSKNINHKDSISQCKLEKKINNL